MQVKKKFELNMKVVNNFLQKYNITLYQFMKVFDISLVEFRDKLRNGFSYDDIMVMAGVMDVSFYELIR